MNFTSPLFLAIIGGFLPTLIWLWYWLKEDKKRPEPRGMILLTFVAGMAAVHLVLPFEKFVYNLFGGNLLVLIILWSSIEELFKFGAAYLAALRSRFMDEPIDAVIYLITASLGFAALENVFFLLTPFGDGEIFQGFVTGNLRFLGATILHTISSASIGVALALSFYRSRFVKIIYILSGILVAVVLHTLFNLFIMEHADKGIFLAFGVMWLLVLALLAFFEKIKTAQRKKITTKEVKLPINLI